MERSPRVLVGVLKNKRDLNLLLREHWYRIPLGHTPKQKFKYLAFYQPMSFGWGGKCIRYYARVAEWQEVKVRSALLPQEPTHPRAGHNYFQIHVRNVRELAQPIRNVLPRRVSFGFTTLRKLRTAKNLLELYGVADTEAIIAEELRRVRIPAARQYIVSGNEGAIKKRYCLDFAVFCKRGKIAIECDNKKAHSGAAQRLKDKVKDEFLARHGWAVIRLTEARILPNAVLCRNSIRRMIHKLGGLLRK